MSGPATTALIEAWGEGGGSFVGWAPGRCTLVGEHVDYAGGIVVAIATHLGIEVAMRRSEGDSFQVASGTHRIQRTTTLPAGDVADRILAAIEALRRLGIDLPPLDIGVSATLPASAGLSSSAAVTCATLVAALRFSGRTLSARAFVAAALTAEREIVGVPCGLLDPSVVVHALPSSAVVLDCATEGVSAVAWPWTDVTLVACATDQSHDVGGAGYRTRRAEADEVMALLGIASVQGVSDDAIGEVPQQLRPRLRHMVTETRRSVAAVAALGNADAAALGVLMDASHESLRDDFAVSTATLDRTVAAARATPGCLGARLVGAGFGGSAVALVATDAASACADSMAGAAGVARERTWVFRPSVGVAAANSDVVDDPR